MRRWAIAFAGTVVLLAARHGRAETCEVPAGASAKLATIDAKERIEFLHRTVDDQARYARHWKWAWFGIGSATLTSSLIQVAGWAAGDDVTREANIIDNLVVSGFSVVTPVAALLFALRVESDAPAIDELLRQTGGGDAGSCLVLARMEELFAKDADEEAQNTGWFAHVLGIVGLGAMFAIMAVEAATSTNPDVRDAHWLNAIGNTAGGLVLTELQILTTPTGAKYGYRAYLKGDLARKSTAFSVGPMHGAPGVSFRVDF